MKIIYSKYKIFGGLSVLIFSNIIFCPVTYLILIGLKKKISEINNPWQLSDFLVPGFVLGFQILILFLLMKECRYIKIDNEKIIFINPLLPFLRKTKYFYEYDYKKTVMEQSRGGQFEAVWLIKNGKLQDRISSFYYSNYKEIKNSIKVKNKGLLRINVFKQIGCILGMKI